MKKREAFFALGLFGLALIFLPACSHNRSKIETVELEDNQNNGLPPPTNRRSVNIPPPEWVSIVKEIVAKGVADNVVRKTLFDFSETGRLLKITEERFGGGGTVIDRTEWTFSYGESNDTGTEINANVQASSGVNIAYSFTLDGSERITHITAMTQGAFEGAPQTELSLEYLGSGRRPSKAIIQSLLEGTVAGGYTLNYEYNNQGYLEKIQQENNLPPAPVSQIEQRFEYDSQGWVGHTEVWRSGTMLRGTDFQNSVAPDGRLTQERSGSFVKTFSYDADGNIKGHCVEGGNPNEKCLEFNYASFLAWPQLFQFLPQPKREAIEKWSADFPDALYGIIEAPAP